MFGERMIETSRTQSWLLSNAGTLLMKTIAVLTVTFAIWAGASRIGEQIAAGTEYETQTIIVRQGDTVWSLAREHGPRGWDLRRTVDLIQELNGLSSNDLGRLQPGQELRIPRK